MQSAIWGFVGALCGALIPSVVTLFNAHRQRRSEIDARVISAAFNYAALEWRGHLDVALSKGSGATLPPTIYLAQALEIARIANSGRSVTADDLKRIEEATKKLAADFRRLDLGNPGLDDY